MLHHLAVSDTSYLVTGTLPSYFMVEPGLKYWIHVLDEEGLQLILHHMILV